MLVQPRMNLGRFRELWLPRRPNFKSTSKKAPTLLSALALLFVILATALHQNAFADTTSGNTTQSSSASSTAFVSVTFDFATAAVVSFVLVLLGLVAGMVLMTRFTGPKKETRAG